MGRVSESKYTVNAAWKDVPHLDATTQRQLLASTPPHLRAARSEGSPSMGAGAIYPIPLEDVTVHPFIIPPYWRRGYGFDVGWNRTAAVWLAENPEDGVLYAYAEHYQGQSIPAIHALAIKARGEWMKGAIDPASRGRDQNEGKQLFVTYQTLGLNIVPADNSVEAGIYEVWSRLSVGRLRFFSGLQNLPSEYRIYRRDENGKIVKKNDHLMDALRYGVLTFPQIASVKLGQQIMTNTARVADPKAGY